MPLHQPGDIVELKGRKYKVTPKHPRQVIDTGIMVTADPKWDWEHDWTPVSNGLAFLAVIPIEEYDEYMKNYDKRNVTPPKSNEPMQHDENGDFTIIGGEKIRL